MKTQETVARVHTHTHTHTDSLIKYKIEKKVVAEVEIYSAFVTIFLCFQLVIKI